MMRGRGTPPLILIFALFAAAAVAWTWPLPTRLGSRVAFDPGDPLLNAWILWWNAQAVPFTDAWWNPPMFYPMRGALTLSEHLAGVGLFTTPLFLAGATPALAYNLALLASCALSGFFTYLLVLRLTGSPAASFCAGLAYALAPFRAGQLSHLQVLTSQWLPVMLLALHGYVDTDKRRWLVLFGAAWIVQSLSNGYYLLFAPALVFLWMLWFVVSRRRWRQAGAIAAAWAISSLALIPALLEYVDVHHALGLTRPLGEILQFSGEPGSFLKPAPMLRFWPERLVPTVEDFLFPGLTVVLAALLAAPSAIASLRRRDDRGKISNAWLFYMLAALAMAALTLGPARPDEGLAGWLRPYQWLMILPGFDGVRVPVRFAMLMALCLAVACGLGLSMIFPARRTLRAVLTVAIAAGLAIDGALEPLGDSPPPGRVELPHAPAAAVLELPPDNTAVNVGAMFRSMSHRIPLINGYSGHVPPHYAILGYSLRRDDPTAVVELARGRTLLLLVSERHDPAGDFRRLVESIPGIERRDRTSAGMSYLLPAQPSVRRDPVRSPYPFTVTRLPRRHVVLDLGTPCYVRTLEFRVRDRFLALDPRIMVEASMDGADWSTVWEDWTGGLALAGALEHQTDVPVRIVLPDVRARYLRVHPADQWLLDELRIGGP